MEIKLNIYKPKGKLCISKEIERTVTAEDFELSTGVCDDVLNAINLDLFEGGLDALSGETAQTLAINLVKNGYPFFIQLLKDIFELTDDEARRLKIEEIAQVVLDIAKYSFKQIASSLGVKKAKN